MVDFALVLLDDGLVLEHGLILEIVLLDHLFQEAFDVFAQYIVIYLIFIIDLDVLSECLDQRDEALFSALQFQLDTCQIE